MRNMSFPFWQKQWRSSGSLWDLEALRHSRIRRSGWKTFDHLSMEKKKLEALRHSRIRRSGWKTFDHLSVEKKKLEALRHSRIRRSETSGPPSSKVEKECRRTRAARSRGGANR